MKAHLVSGRAELGVSTFPDEGNAAFKTDAGWSIGESGVGRDAVAAFAGTPDADLIFTGKRDRADTGAAFVANFFDVAAVFFKQGVALSRGEVHGHTSFCPLRHLPVCILNRRDAAIKFCVLTPDSRRSILTDG